MQSDGEICPVRDPPGQLSVYIIPGDPKKEVYRLATFQKYPITAAQNPWDLAKAGFFYTGHQDQTKCSRCGRQIRNWNGSDNPRDAIWHELDCQFNENNPEHNIPILSEVRRTNSNQVRREVTQGEINAIIEPSPERTLRRLVEIESEGASASNQPCTNVMLREMFPCENPYSPHLRSWESRLTTFTDHAVSWHRNNISATMEDMVEAGLYYIGVRDKVKCWYCNGGLQNWNRTDNPWIEHTRWFPTCEFVLQNKGPEYVSEITRRYPNPERSNPLIRSQRPSGPINVAPIIIIDPQKERVQLRQQTQVELETSPIVSGALRMGFTKEQIAVQVERRLELHKRGYAQLRTLVEDLLREPEKADINSEDEETTPLKGKETLNEAVILRKLMYCKRCKEEKAVILTLPCGHIRLCEECAKNTHRCPECGHTIQKTVRTYRV